MYLVFFCTFVKQLYFLFALISCHIFIVVLLYFLTAAAIQAAPKRAKNAVKVKERTQREFILCEVGMKKIRIPAAASTSRASASAGGDEGEDDGLGAEQGGAGAQFGKGKGGKGAKGSNKDTFKVVRQSFAVGGLDKEFMDWGMTSAGNGAKSGGMTKQQIREAARAKPFTDYDATKQLRKGGKVGNKAFKSKSKFKRR